jgi:hypothetical protein
MRWHHVDRPPVYGLLDGACVNTLARTATLHDITEEAHHRLTDFLTAHQTHSSNLKATVHSLRSPSEHDRAGQWSTVWEVRLGFCPSPCGRASIRLVYISGRGSQRSNSSESGLRGRIPALIPLTDWPLVITGTVPDLCAVLRPPEHSVTPTLRTCWD